jgi:hypothetical protein
MNAPTNNSASDPIYKQQATLKRLSDADENDVKEIAIAQLELLSNYYELSLSQAARSFRWALIASMVGLVFFMAAISFLLNGNGSPELAIVSTIGGAVTEFIAGVNFFLYGKTLEQLNLFQGKLEATQRFLLANSLCENLGGNLRDKTRARLIGKLVGVDDHSYLNDASANNHGNNPAGDAVNGNPQVDMSGDPLPMEEGAAAAAAPQ